MKTKTWRYGLALIAVLLVFAALVSLSSPLQAQTAPSTYSAYTGTDVKTVPSPPALGPANSVITDPTFGSRILRVTDQNTNGGESFIPTDAGFHRTWNANSTAIKLTGPRGDAYWLEFNPSSFTVGDGSSRPAIHSLPFGDTWEWSTVDPNVIYFLSGSAIKSYNKSTGAAASLGTTANGAPVGYMAVVIGQDNWVCAAAGTGGQNYYTQIMCVNPGNPSANKFIDVYNKTINGVAQSDPNWPKSASGQVIGVHDISGGTGASWLEVTFHQASWGANGGAVLNLATNTWSEVTAADNYWSGHVSMGNGRYANSSGSINGSDSRGMVLRDPNNLMNSQAYRFIGQPPATNNGWCDADHSSWLNSMSNPNAPILWSRYNACPYTWAGEIDALAVDGSNTVWRFAHTHNEGSGCYYAEGFAQISNDGNWALFSSYWGGKLGSDTSFGCTGRIDTFIVALNGAATTTAAPSNTSPPGVSGSAAQGSTLAATTGTWSGSPTSYAYQWLRCSSTGANCGAVSGATGSSYLLGSADVGYVLCVKVTAANSGGSNSAMSADTPVVQGTVTASAPVNTAAPSISGSAVQGQTLTASLGTWSNSPTSYKVQWQHCISTGCGDVSGANSQSYLPGAADVDYSMRVVVLAMNSAGSAVATSVQTAVVQASTTTTTPPPSTSAIALLQSGSAQGTVVASVAKAFGGANTAGNMIIAFVRISGTSQTVTLTDSLGNNYVKAASQQQTSDGHTSYLFYASNIKGGANTVTASFAASNKHPWLAVYEYSGLSKLDKTSSAQGYGTSVSSGAMATTTSATELMFAGVGLPASSTAQITPASGCTMLQQNVYPNGTAPGGNEHMAMSGTGSYAGGFTLSAAANWSAVVATFAGASTTTTTPPSITTYSLPGGTVNSAYSATLAATGGTPPYSWSVISGALPAGLALNAGTGTISGTPTTAGTASFSVQVKDANAQTASASLSITINSPTPTVMPVSITTTSLPAGTANTAYSATLTASGGTAPYSWSVRSGALPAGLSLTAGTGAISGTPTTAATSTFTVTAKDAGAQTASTSLSITVNPQATTTPAIKLVQSASVQGTGVGSIARAFPAVNTAGNLIIAFVRMSTTTQTVTVTDSAGNAYVSAVSQAQTSDGHQACIFYAKNIKGGANTVTATFSGTNNHPWLAVYEYNGVSTLDQTAHAQGYGATAGSGATAATTSANELVFTGMGVPSSASVSVTAASGKMEQFDNTLYGSQAANEDGTTTSTGSFAGSFSLSSSQNWSCVTATFK